MVNVRDVGKELACAWEEPSEVVSESEQFGSVCCQPDLSDQHDEMQHTNSKFLIIICSSARQEETMAGTLHRVSRSTRDVSCEAPNYSSVAQVGFRVYPFRQRRLRFYP